MSALLELTPEEEANFQRLVEAAKALMRGEAERVRLVYIDARSDEIAARRGIPKAEARWTVEAAVSEKADLYPDFLLKFDRHGWVSVADVLADLKKYDRATLADPLEPDYNGGRNVAILYANIGKGRSIIHSFAHGDKVYRLHAQSGSNSEGAPPEGEKGRERAYGKKAYPYVVADGAIHYIKRTKEGDVEVPLCNFDARITQEVIHDDGAEVQSLFLIEGSLASGRKLPAIEVTTTIFAGLSWVTANWGNSPVVYAGSSIKDHLRCAIQKLSGSVPRHTIYGHYGWRRLGGEWVYLHAGGALGSGGNRTDIEVAADKGAMRLYCLPDPPEGDGLVRAIRASLKLKDIGRSKVVGHALIATTYRAPLGEAYRIDLSLFLAGYTGQMKSEMTAMSLAHFGQEFDSRRFPASWEDTETDIEVKAFHAKDAIFVVDDFKPKGGDSDINRLHAKADRFLRGTGNQSGRGRRTSTLQAKPSYYSRGFVLSSGEDIPRGQSLRARLCIVEVKPGEVDKEVLTYLQQAGSDGLLAQSMAGFIRWLAPRMDEFKEMLPDKVRAYRKDAERYSHSRFIDNYANLLAGLEVFLTFAVDVGAIAEPERVALLAEGAAVLDELMRDQAVYQVDSDESIRFFSLLTSAMVSDRCHLVDLYSQGEPSNPRDYGWRQFSVRDKDGNEELKWRPIGACIGWVDDEKLYLDPEATFATIQKFASDQKEPFPVTQRTLWKRLADKGLLVDRDLNDGKNRASSRKWIGDKSRRVAVVLKSSLDSGKELPTKKTSGNARDPHEHKAEGQHSHSAHYSEHNPPTFSESRDNGNGRADSHADAVEEKNREGYVWGSGISGNVEFEANTSAGFSHSHSPESVGIPSHSQNLVTEGGGDSLENAEVF